MRLFDLHCDTLYKAVTENKDLSSDDCHISVNKTDFLEKWIQCFAVWIPDNVTDEYADFLFDKGYKILKENCEKYGISLLNNFNELKTSINNCNKCCFLTVENGKLLHGKLENIDKLNKYNVKMITLTWNGDNEIGTGALTRKKSGLTDFGFKAVKRLEESGIVVDVSHASRSTFYDVAYISEKPFIATHSNSYTVTKHKRNLTDEQFSIIKDRGGIVGINFYKEFLNNNEKEACMYDILKHTEHFLSLGGENTVAIGSDFDGCDLTNDIKDIKSTGEIYELFLKENYSESLLNKLFFYNAFNFCRNFDNL